MAYLHSRFLMAVTPVVISVLMATLAMKMFEPRLFVSASEKGWFPLSLFVSIPFYFYLSYLLEIEEKRRTFRANVIGFLRGVSEEIRRSTREHRDQGEIRHGGTELGVLTNYKGRGQRARSHQLYIGPERTRHSQARQEKNHSGLNMEQIRKGLTSNTQKRSVRSSWRSSNQMNTTARLKQ